MSSQHRRTKKSPYFPSPELTRRQHQLKARRQRMTQEQMFAGLTTPELNQWLETVGIMLEWCRNVRSPRRGWENEERATLAEIKRREEIHEPPNGN